MMRSDQFLWFVVRYAAATFWRWVIGKPEVWR